MERPRQANNDDDDDEGDEGDEGDEDRLQGLANGRLLRKRVCARLALQIGAQALLITNAKVKAKLRAPEIERKVAFGSWGQWPLFSQVTLQY